MSHNPSSNLRLRAGIAPLNGLLEAGVNIAIGMDGTTLNDDEDMFTEMRLAMRLHRTPVLGGPAPEPNTIFDLATRGGARLLMLEDQLGRIASGHKADLVLSDLNRVIWPWIAPEVNPRDLLLLRACAGDVDTVLVNGEIVLREGLPTQFDLKEVGSEIAERLNSETFHQDNAEIIDTLIPHLKSWYENWEIPELNPWIRYNSKY